VTFLQSSMFEFGSQPTCVCGLSSNLECMSEVRCTWLAQNTGRKNLPKICQAVYLRNYGSIHNSKKN